MNGSSGFVVHSRLDPETGTRKPQVTAKCQDCGKEEHATVKNPGWGLRIFKRRGWTLGRTRDRDTCPDCLHPAHEPQHQADVIDLVAPELHELPPHIRVEPKPGSKTAGGGVFYDTGFTRRDNCKRSAVRFHAAAGVPDAQEGVHFEIIEEPGRKFGWAFITTPPTTTTAEEPAPMSDASTQAVRDAQPDNVRQLPTAAPPREASRDDNRKIRDALDAAYDEAAGRYKGDGSDAKIADSLKMPRAWVARIRDTLFGPDGNEEAAMKAAALDGAVREAEAALARITQAVEQGMKVMTEAEGLVNELKSKRAALKV